MILEKHGLHQKIKYKTKKKEGEREMHNNKKFHTRCNLTEFIYSYYSEFFINSISLYKYPMRIGTKVHRQQGKVSNAS